MRAALPKGKMLVPFLYLRTNEDIQGFEKYANSIFNGEFTEKSIIIRNIIYATK